MKSKLFEIVLDQFLFPAPHWGPVIIEGQQQFQNIKNRNSLFLMWTGLRRWIINSECKLKFIKIENKHHEVVTFSALIMVTNLCSAEPPTCPPARRLLLSCPQLTSLGTLAFVPKLELKYLYCPQPTIF